MMETHENKAPFMARLEKLFARMDSAYDATAARCGFECRGCADNCCHTRFYHHTWAEFFYLKAAFSALPEDERRDILKNAESWMAEAERLEAAGQRIRVMCPLNRDGKCRMYIFRPMICRLHGIAHRLTRPDGKILTGPGCDAFEQMTACGNSAVLLDRTPLYMELSGLESELREALELPKKGRQTIAEMLLSFEPESSQIYR